ncbi:MAG: polysaccharide deacetylase family protein [Clostridia bacterium]|nr:polysaccharide deacetylase family protein [Clostridia bacterium]
MKKLALFALMILLLFSVACAKEAQEAALPTESPYVTAPPTAVPTATPDPIPAPMITDEWYTNKINKTVGYVMQYGNCPDEYEARLRVANMYLDPNSKMIALTYDGAANQYAVQIMDILEQHNARATFFISGTEYESCKDVIGRMLALGCEVGSHSVTHPDFRDLNQDQMRTEISYCVDQMKAIFDYDVTTFRPPYGSYNDDVKAVCKEMGIKIIMWFRSSHDSHSDYTADMIYERVMLEIDENDHELAGATILFHLNDAKTVEATARFIPDLIAQGYTFVTCEELFKLSPDGYNPGGVYRYQ